MSGTKEGGIKTVATLKAKNPDHYKVIGALGGKKSRKGGFYGRSAEASAAGRKGGLAPHRKRGRSAEIK